jgi:hypothetical protein
MQASRTMAFFTSNIPLGHGLGLQIVVNGMAAIAGRACWPIGVLRAIKWHPPVGASLDVIGKPFLVFYIPLCRKWKVVITNFGEVPLLPQASIGKRYLIQGERAKRICVGEISEHGVGMHFGVANDICHSGLLPGAIDLSVAFLTTL